MRRPPRSQRPPRRPPEWLARWVRAGWFRLYPPIHVRYQPRRRPDGKVTIIGDDREPPTGILHDASREAWLADRAVFVSATVGPNPVLAVIPVGQWRHVGVHYTPDDGIHAVVTRPLPERWRPR